MVEMRCWRCDAGDADAGGAMDAKEKRHRWTLSTGISALGLPLRAEHIQLDVIRPSSMPHTGNLSEARRLPKPPNNVCARAGKARPHSAAPLRGPRLEGRRGRGNVLDPDAVIGRRRRHPTSERARPEIVHVKTVFAEGISVIHRHPLSVGVSRRRGGYGCTGFGARELLVLYLERITITP
jgi:hypothetical protein